MRVAAVEALPESDALVVAAIARDDESPRVRRAAVARLADLDALGEIAHRDADAQVRADAAVRLLGIATDAADEGRAAQAAQAVTDDRHVAQIARTSAHLSVAHAALERVRDGRALGSTARNAQHEAVRLRALERISDLAEIEAVAINTEHKDVGLAAVDRLSDIAILDGVAERARNKVVGRRARAIVRDHQMREADARETTEARARRQALLADAAESLERLRDATRGRAEIARLSEDFAASGDAGPELASRFDAAVTRLRAHFDAIERQDAAADAARAARDASVAARQALIERAAAVDGEDVAPALAELDAEWAALARPEDVDLGALTTGFEHAKARAAGRLVARARSAAQREEVAALIAEAEAILGVGDLTAARAQWHAWQARWTSTTSSLEIEPALAERVQAATAAWAARDHEARAARVREKHRQRERLEEIGARAASVAATPDASLKDLDHAVRDLRTALEQLPDGGDGLESVVVQMKGLMGLLGPRLREQREAEDWRRWANAGIQEELVKRMEALKAGTDLPEVARQVRDLRRQWKAVSAGPREETDTLWQRFKAAMDEVQTRCDEHYAKVAEEQAAHLATRLVITEAAEALAQSSDWIATADTLKRLQNEWNAAGPAPRDAMAELARRFRTACDTFFTRRKTDLADRKQVWSVNSQKKEALCARAEALADSTDWQAALTDIKQLQAEWKAVGAVRKNRSETLWKRFRGACDLFFGRYGRRHELAHQQKVQEREQACQTLEALASAAREGAPAPDDLLASIEDVWRRWHESPGLPAETLNPLRARVDTAMETLLHTYVEAFKGSRFDVSAATARREALLNDVESVLKGTARQAEIGATPAATLAALLKESLAANTIGGRVNEDAKLRVAGDKVRRAQQAWRDLGPALTDASRALDARFQKAVRRFFEQHPDQRHPPRR